MSILAPAFLAGLLAVFLPWWLHRLSRDNPPRQDFGSSMFLEAGETMSSKQTKLRYRKLFALRFLLLALLALLFAEPAMKFTRLLAGSDYRQILIVDTSLSQRLGDRWNETRNLVEQKLGSIAESDEVFLIDASHQFVQAEGDGTIAGARSQLAQMTPGLTRLDYGQLPAAITELVETSSLPVNVHLFTDIQTTSMPTRLSDLSLDGIELFEVHATAGSDDSNISVNGRLSQGASGETDVTAIVNNHSDSATQATLQLLSGDTLLASSDIDVEAESSHVQLFSKIDTGATNGVLELRLAPDTAGTTTGRTKGDALSEDNSWLIALPEGSRTEVTLLQSNSLANQYAAAAIESDPRYRTRLIEGENLSASVAGGLLIVADASALSDRAAAKLKQYLNDGGNALIAVGADPHSVQMRKLLKVRSASAKQSATLSAQGSGATNGSSAQDPIPGSNSLLQPQVIGRIDDTHPLTSDTANNWRSVSVVRYLPLDVDSGDRTIIALGDESPLLLERNIGNGTVIILTSALKSSWNDLAVNPLFVAFVIGAIENLSGVNNTDTFHTVGETITIPPGAQLIDPDGEPVRGLSEINRKGRATLSERGIYTVRSSTGSTVLSVNTDTRESDTRTIDSEKLEQWQRVATTAQSAGDVSTNARANTSEPAENRATNRYESLWRWILPLLALLVLIESLYSHRHLWIKREA